MHMNKMITAIVLIASIWLAGCGKKDSQSRPPQKPMPVVRAVQAVTGTLAEELKLTGSVIATRVARICSPAEGPVMNCKIREGDAVQKDMPLLTIGRRNAADALVEAARESLAREEEELRRIDQLVGSGAIAAEEIDMARLRAARANAELSKALESAEDYKIKAPWEGLVSKVYVTDGHFVTPREPLLEVYDPCSLVICAAVPEKNAAAMAAGMRVEVSMDAYPDDRLSGRVERVYTHLDSRLRTRTIEIVLDQPVALAPGMFARLNVQLKTVHAAVIVPVESLVPTPKGQAIFVVEDGKASKRSVETGLEQGNRVQVVTGIGPGDKIIVAGNEKLKDGAVVRISGQETAVKDKPQNMPGQGNQQKKKMEGGQQ